MYSPMEDWSSIIKASDMQKQICKSAQKCFIQDPSCGSIHTVYTAQNGNNVWTKVCLCCSLATASLWFKRSLILETDHNRVPVPWPPGDGPGCDGCFKRIGRGPQFKCTDCWDYDLCETCYLEKGMHRKRLFITCFSHFGGIRENVEKALCSVRGMLTTQLSKHANFVYIVFCVITVCQ